VLSQKHFPTSGKSQALITMLLLGGIISTAITGLLSPALSVPLAAVAVLLLGCVKVTDTYKSVDWQAVATVGGMKLSYYREAHLGTRRRRKRP
jgi:hypothetical protein